MVKMDPWNLLYITIYVATGSTQSLLIKLSKNKKLAYEAVAVTLTVEFSKLMIGGIIYFFIIERDIPVQTKLNNLLKKWHQARLFCIPAGLYCVYNALNFYSLDYVEPATFRILINSKVIFSGILLQLLCGVYLSVRQWIGLVLLFIACGVEQLGSFNLDTGIFALMMISFQSFCSSMAGVYFQLLLKRQDPQQQQQEPSLWEKNFFLYCWSCILNVVYLGVTRPTILQPSQFMSTFNEYTLPIVLMSVCGGLSTSLILRYMDVIIKEYANFIEMCLVVGGASYLFGTPINPSLTLSIILVTVSLYLYNVPHATPAAPSPAGYKPVKIEEPDQHEQHEQHQHDEHHEHHEDDHVEMTHLEEGASAEELQRRR